MVNATKQDNEELARICRQRREQYAQSSVELSDFLPRLIQSNIYLLRILAKYESAVVRLYTVKLLLQALRKDDKQEVVDFKKIASALAAEIQKARISDQSQEESLGTIISRINDLQDHVFETYDLLSQGDLSILAQATQSSFLERITDVAKNLQSKELDLVSFWSDRNIRALAKEELQEVTIEREHLAAHVSSVVKMLEQLADRMRNWLPTD